jgi:hypothetical protein
VGEQQSGLFQGCSWGELFELGKEPILHNDLTEDLVGDLDMVKVHERNCGLLAMHSK